MAVMVNIFNELIENASANDSVFAYCVPISCCFLAGIPHDVEFQRMAAVINMAFRIQSADVELCNSALTFYSGWESSGFGGGSGRVKLSL